MNLIHQKMQAMKKVVFAISGDQSRLQHGKGSVYIYQSQVLHYITAREDTPADNDINSDTKC